MARWPKRILPSLVALGALLTPPAAPDRAHPADGPDIDVRIRIGSEKVVCAILLNLAFMDEIIDSPRENETTLHPVEFESHKLELLDYFQATNRITADGQPLTAEVTGFEYTDADPTLLPLFPLQRERALAKLRLVLEYPVTSHPEQVGITWGEFPPDLVLVDDEGNAPPIVIPIQLTARGIRKNIELYEHEPEFLWHDTGESALASFAAVPESDEAPIPELPILSIALLALAAGGTVAAVRGGLAGRPWLAVTIAGLGVCAWLTTDLVRVPMRQPKLPSEEEALAVFSPLHANIYKAFDFGDESDIYDALALSVDGELLERLYTQIYTSLILQDEGGAVSQVQSVTPIQATVESIGLVAPDDTAGFTVNATWQVEGAVFHWGHSHTRVNEYQARYSVARTERGWRIVDNEILQQLLVSTASTDPRDN